VVLYGLGAVLAAGTGAFRVGDYVVGQVAITFTQLMTHYANDFFDLDADRANRTPTRWSGGSRVLVDGTLSPRVALAAALALAAGTCTLAVSMFLSPRPTPGTSWLLLVAVLLSWEYSAPPLRLHSHGAGPPTAALVVGALTPLIGYGMQGAPWSAAPLLAVVPTAMAQFAMILVLDFPDAAGDGHADKRTLVVLLGDDRASVLCTSVLASLYAVLPLLVLLGWPSRMALAVATSAPLAAWLAWTLRRASWRGRPARLTFAAVTWFAWIAGAELAMAVWARVTE
jgi:1,4-dihydroxy-2-naphthoate octaprenyltransferase